MKSAAIASGPHPAWAMNHSEAFRLSTQSSEPTSSPVEKQQQHPAHDEKTAFALSQADVSQSGPQPRQNRGRGHEIAFRLR